QRASAPQPEGAAGCAEEVAELLLPKTQNRGRGVRKRLEQMQHANAAIPIGCERKYPDKPDGASCRQPVDDARLSPDHGVHAHTRSGHYYVESPLEVHTGADGRVLYRRRSS